jgi:phosphoglycerate kinase
MEKLTHLPVKNKKVVVRVDFNVPLNKDGSIADDTRIRESLPSIRYIIEHGGAVILMSHLGRPEGKANPKYSLKPCAARLSELLHTPVAFAADCIGPEARKLAASLQPQQILLLENLRFHEAEEQPDHDPSFAKQLAQLGDCYVNDAFGSAHRAHASTYTICHYFPGKAAAGFLMEKEMKAFAPLLSHPQRPFFAIIGGAKISSKIKLLTSLLSKVDKIFIGGGMCYTFFKAQGIPIGASIHEDDFLDGAKTFLKQAGSKVCLPRDVVIADGFKEDAPSKTIPIKEGIPGGWQGMDIGQETRAEWVKELKPAKTLFWNGPLGVFEFPSFAKGTHDIALALAHMKNTHTMIGGGDSVSAVQSLNLADRFSHLSTGGGAALEYLELGHLPGIDALTDVPPRLM